MEPPEVVLVGGQPGQVLGRDLAKQRDRIPAGLLPAGRVERGEQVPRLGVPGPAEVQHEIAQRSERLGQRGPDREGADGSHAERPYRLPGTSGFELIGLPPSRALRWLREACPRRRDTATALGRLMRRSARRLRRDTACFDRENRASWAGRNACPAGWVAFRGDRSDSDQ